MTAVRTKAILIEGRDVRYGELELPELGPDEVLVASRRVGICRSDVELLEGHLDAQLGVPYPIVPGHEWAGAVEAVGERVANVAPGDRVVGECVIAPNHWFGFTYNGTGSERFVAPARLLHRLPGSLSFEQAALVEPFTIAYRAIRASGGTDGSEVVAIVGGGMIGQCCLAVARAMGAVTVVIEPSERRRALARQLGADLVLEPGDGVADEIHGAAGVDGADLVLEASGQPAGLASTFELARFGGRVTNIGICAHPSVSAPLGLVQAKDLLVRGTTGSAGVWPAALRFVERHGIDLSPVISGTFTFAQAREALAASRDTETYVKIHLTP